MSDQSSAPTDPAAIEAEIEARRERLATTVDQLAVRLHPKEIARRGTEGAKVKARTKADELKMLVGAKAQDAKMQARAAATTPDGKVRVERVGAVGGALLVIVLLAVWRRLRH